jgi:hypothetical protein
MWGMNVPLPHFRAARRRSSGGIAGHGLITAVMLASSAERLALGVGRIQILPGDLANQIAAG